MEQTRGVNTEQRQEIIRLLEQGEDLSPEWARILFPPEKREYELVYYGKEREEDIIANTLALPLQQVRAFGNNRQGWQNMLIFGDNLQIMKSLLELKKSGKLCNADGTPGVRLVYIDPPFGTKQEFKGTQDQKAYQDRIAGSRFLEFLRKRLILIRELLADDGYVFVHLDQKKSHYMKVLMDEVFGEQNFLNHIIWSYRRWPSSSRNFQSMHDDIFMYAARATNANRAFNIQYEAPSESYLKRFQGKTQVLDESTGTRKITVDEPTKGMPRRDVWDLSIVAGFKGERTEYPTQKPESLLARMIEVCSNKGDLVLDAFVGSGTTCAVAEKLQRRWVCIDCGKLAISATQKRMLNLRREVGHHGPPLNAKPFTLYNAGLYDFSKLRELSWESWRFFALQLFQCRDEPHKIGGIRLDGYLKGASVLVFNHQKQVGARIDADTIESIHEALGTKVGNKLFVIAPAMTFDFQQDWLDLDAVRYYALRIPYSIINELHHREFTALKQPSDEMAVNDTVDAVGFDFIRTPELKFEGGIVESTKNSEGFIRIKTFKSEAVVREPIRTKENLETLSLVMIDYDFDEDSQIFDLDAVFYADSLRTANWELRFSISHLGQKLMAVFVDIYGNEARVLIDRSKFSSKPRVNRKRRTPQTHSPERSKKR